MISVRRQFILALVITLLFAVSAKAHAAKALFVKEVNTGGMTKQCVYDYLGSKYVITISSVKICPMSIDV